jgi:hypothetical protein
MTRQSEETTERIAMPPTAVHFNGSVNLPDAETVMREISSRIPRGVRRMTDGEPGDRNYWINFQTRKFEDMPEFETVSVGQAYETAPDAPPMPQMRLTEGASAEMINWPNLGYADAYTESFATFDRLQNEGTIPGDVRFQIQYPTPLASIAGTIAPNDMAKVAPSYEQALFADLDTALERLPHDRIAVQWDVAVEFGALEGAMGPKVPIGQIAPGLVRCLEQVPTDVPVGMHLCYGDYGHQHFKQPESLQMQVDLVNAVTSAAKRALNFVSFTVPQGRSDIAYFEPLGGLKTGPETELYFALVPYHPDDQAPGATAEQIESIDAVLINSPGGARHWGICTECGMGRVDAGDVPRLLDLHSQILSSSKG